MPLLLEGDEQEDMVRRYLWRGMLYAGYEAGALVAVCVVTEEDGSTVEIKNLAVHRDFRRRGFGRNVAARGVCVAGAHYNARHRRNPVDTVVLPQMRV